MNALEWRLGLKLRQGMGRLIRSQNDMGVCILTDPRLLNKRYGNIILESINLNPIIFNDDNLVLNNHGFNSMYSTRSNG